MTSATIARLHSARLADRRQLLTLSAVAASVLAVGYFLWNPQPPDLAAQVARAQVVRRAGNIDWWTGWFGGLSLPSYSVIAPAWMAAIGVRLAGAIATVIGGVGLGLLIRDAPRARAGAIAFCTLCAADVVLGRATFAAGVAAAVWSLIALRAHRWLITLVLAGLAALASPLAGLFLGIAVVAVAVSDRERRALAAASAGLLLLLGLGLLLLYPNAGRMPFGWADAVRAALCCAAVAVLCKGRVIRTGALITLASIPVLMIVPGAIGANIARLAWMCTVPLVLAYSTVPVRRLVAIAALAALWPAFDVAGQLLSSNQASSRRAFYQPVLDELRVEQSGAGEAAIGQRVELVDTANHWGSAYLSQVALARGWDRQADVADNAIFYTADGLTASSYRQWLDELAVGWVALPNAPLDHAAKAEGRLVRSGLPYLQLTWRSSDWALYRVLDAAPLAVGATVVSVTPAHITLRTAGPAVVATRVRYAPSLSVTDPASKVQVGCVTNADGWVQVQVPRAATFTLGSGLRSASAGATGQTCSAGR